MWEQVHIKEVWGVKAQFGNYVRFWSISPNLSVWSPNHDLFVAVFKEHYILTLEGVF